MLAIGRSQFVQMQLRGGEAAISEDACRLVVIRQHMRSGNPVALMLTGLFAQIGIQHRDATDKAGAVV